MTLEKKKHLVNKLSPNSNNLGYTKGHMNKATDPSNIASKGTHAICTITWLQEKLSIGNFCLYLVLLLKVKKRAHCNPSVLIKGHLWRNNSTQGISLYN